MLISEKKKIWGWGWKATTTNTKIPACIPVD